MFNKPAKTVSDEDITEIVLTKKILKSLEKKHKNDFRPNTSSVKRLCNIGSHPEYFIQIRNRILRELGQNNGLGEFVLFDMDDLEDIRLSADGVFIFFEILTSYFDEKDVRDLFILMREMDKPKRAEYDLQYSLSSMTKKELKDFIAGYKDYIPEKGMEEGKQILMDMAQEELKKRKLFA